MLKILFAVLLVVVVGFLAYTWIGIIPDDWGVVKTEQLAKSQVFANVVGPLSAIAAFLALVINFGSSNTALAQSIRTEQAGRFQKGVELLSSGEKPSSRTAGVTLLAGLAQENAKSYLAPAAVTIAASLTELDSEEFKKGCSLFQISNRAPYEGEFPPAAVDSSIMMEWFGTIRRRQLDRWPRALRHHLLIGRFPLFAVYLEDGRYLRQNYARTDLERAVFKDVSFIGCNLADATWSGSVAGPLLFENCDLRNARLKFWGTDNKLIWNSSSVVGIHGGLTTGLQINSLGLDEWLRGEEANEEAVRRWDTTPSVRDPFGFWSTVKSLNPRYL